MNPSVLLAAALSAAAPPPVVFPREDVVVTYGVAGRDGVGETLSVSAASGLERLDAPGGLLSVVTDTVDGTALVIDRQSRTFVRQNAPGGKRDLRDRAAPPGLYTATGAATVAGLACTVYRSTDPDTGAALRSCYTPDGILLRVEAAGRPALVALSVRRGALDPALFRPPEGARDVTPPS